MPRSKEDTLATALTAAKPNLLNVALTKATPDLLATALEVSTLFPKVFHAHLTCMLYLQLDCEVVAEINRH